MSSHTWILNGLWVIPALLITRATASPDDPVAVETAVVGYTIAPGEDGSPRETVTVSRRGEERTIVLSHTDGEGVTTSETLPLSPKEFDAVWEVVVRQKLVTFEPDAKSGTAFDYGTRTLRTEVREKAGGELRKRESRWARPIENHDRVTPLIEKLAELARSHGKAVKLELFVPR